MASNPSTSYKVPLEFYDVLSDDDGDNFEREEVVEDEDIIAEAFYELGEEDEDEDVEEVVVQDWFLFQERCNPLKRKLWDVVHTIKLNNFPQETYSRKQYKAARTVKQLVWKHKNKKLPSPARTSSRQESPILREETRDRSRSPLSPAHGAADLPIAEEPVVIVGQRGQGQRGRGRGAGRTRGGRGRHAPNMGSGRPSDAWCRGDRIHEIYVTDDDVPEDLKETIMQVYARREAQQSRSGRRMEARAAEDDEYFDADDGGDAALFAGEEDATHFDWRPMDTFSPVKETFLPQQTGPTTASGSAYEAFRQYWDDGILSHIVSETNRYAASKAFADWYDTNMHEILVLFSFWMMLGIIRMPSIKSCFSTHYLLSTSCFKLMFTRDRYERLCSCLNFNNNDLRTPDSSKLFPIEPILDHLNRKFQEAYIPRQEICIDESLTLWKGNLSFGQYIKTKAAKFGIKTFELCESATGYLWSFFVYTGKDSKYHSSLPSSLLKSTASVLTLVTPLLNKGYTLFMDNWFNSPLLARFLKRNKTDVVGTLRMNRQHVPSLITLCKLQAGQFVARHSEDMMVMAYHDRKKMALLSTCHGTETAAAPPKPNRPTAWKPQLILDYNKSMGGVDMKDGMLEGYLLERKRCSKWYMKLFKRLLNCSILNSRICYEASAGVRIEHTVFRLELVDQILSYHLESVSRRPCRPRPAVPESRFTQNRHWPTSNTGTTAAGRRSRRRCVQCTRLTVFECRLCDVGLCAEVCFGAYHTRP